MEEVAAEVIDLYRQLDPGVPVRRVRCRRGSCAAWYWISARAYHGAVAVEADRIILEAQRHLALSTSKTDVAERPPNLTS